MSKTVLTSPRGPKRVAEMQQWLSKHEGHRVWWGHWYRVMKRRTQPKSLIHICMDCKDELHVPHPTEEG